MILLVAGVFVGCTGREENSTADQSKPHAAPDQPRPSLTLRVLVVNDVKLVEAINRLRGEWQEQGSGELIASDVPWEKIADEKTIDADVLIFPSRYLGVLASRGLLRPVRSNVLESEELNATDFYPMFRQSIVRWGDQSVALPLGARPIVADGNSLAADGMPSLQFLAMAAPNVVSENRLGVLFDAETMKPRITEQPFVDALEKLIAIKKQPVSGDANAEQGEVVDGKVSAEAATSSQVAQAKVGSRVSESRRGAALVPIVGYDDRLGAVSASSRNAASAFKLLQWLAEVGPSTQLAQFGGPVVPVRRSLAKSAKWYGSQVTADQLMALSGTIDTALGGERFLAVPRIPGIDDYLSALDNAVTAATTGETQPAAALAAAAERWEKITDSRGRDAQRNAYLLHLGLAE